MLLDEFGEVEKAKGSTLAKWLNGQMRSYKFGVYSQDLRILTKTSEVCVSPNSH